MSFQRRSQVFKAWNIRSKQLTSPFLAGMLPLLLLWLSPMIADALSSSSLKTSFPTLSLQSVEATQLAIFDGPEWQSIRSLQNASLSTAKYGFMNVVVGKNSDGQQVIGIQCASSENNLYQESVVQIPPRIKKEDAIATYIAAISAVHAVLPKAEQVGGSEEVMIGGKVVILGGNELACFAAEGLASLGVHVCLVSSGNPKIKSTNGGKGAFCHIT